jgi:hypothetical protein
VSINDLPTERFWEFKPPGKHDIEDLAKNSEDLDAAASNDDSHLVERCIGGEVAAWDELYHKCHAPLCTTIRIQLGRSGTDSHLVDEMAARVWYALVDRDGKQLAKYNPRRGSILTFIRLIARKEISHHFRAEQRRLKKELSSMVRKNQPRNLDPSDFLPTMLAEFLASLTPRERDFCYEHLQISASESRMPANKLYSSASIWQLTRRIYKKFLSYIGSIS